MQWQNSSRRNSQSARFEYQTLESRFLMDAGGLLEVDPHENETVFQPLVVAGDPSINPVSNPNSLVDDFRADSAFSGVVSINPRNGSDSFICSGALISANHVLTAAHCFDFNDNGQVDAVASQSNVFFGSESGTSSIGIDSITIHPDYTGFNRPSVNDDIAVITLSQSAPAFAQIYEISDDPFNSPEAIVISGFGNSGTGVDGFTTGASFTTRRVGENVASRFFLDDEGSGRREVFLFDFDGPTGATNTLSDGLTLGNAREVTIGGGDSGGPSFIHNDFNSNGSIDVGELELFGINTFGRSVGFTSAPFFGSQGGGIVASSYLEFIDSFGNSDGSSQSQQLIGEIDNIVADSNFRRIDFGRSFANPVIIAGPPSTNGGSPAVVRIRNVDATGFEIRIEEYDYLNRQHVSETVSVLVVEAGTYELADGTVITAGNVDTINDTASRVTFENEFRGRPIVLGQVTTQNGGSTVAPRVQAVRSDGFTVRLQEQESFDDGHVNETLSYLAIERGQGDAAGGLSFDAILTPRDVTNRNYEVEFDTNIGSDGAVFANLQSFRGVDTSAIRLRSQTANQSTLFIQEERSLDNEVFHTQERVGVLAIEAGFLFGTRQTDANSQSAEVAVAGSDLGADLSQEVALSRAVESGADDLNAEFADTNRQRVLAELSSSDADSNRYASADVIDLVDELAENRLEDFFRIDSQGDELFDGSMLKDMLLEARDSIG